MFLSVTTNYGIILSNKRHCARAFYIYLVVGAFLPFSLLSRVFFFHEIWILQPARVKSSLMFRGSLGNVLKRFTYNQRNTIGPWISKNVDNLVPGVICSSSRNVVSVVARKGFLELLVSLSHLLEYLIELGGEGWGETSGGRGLYHVRQISCIYFIRSNIVLWFQNHKWRLRNTDSFLTGT